MSKRSVAARSCGFIASWCVLSLAGPARLGAQTAAEARPSLTLADVYRWAEAAVPSVEAARARVRASEARARSATIPADPMVSVGVMNRELPRLGPMRPLDMTLLQATQMVPLGGKLRLAGDLADRQTIAARERARGAQLDVRANAAAAFFELYSVDRSLTLAKESQALLRDIREAARAMYSVGRGRQADVLRADVALGRMAEDVIRMETMRQIALSRLGSLLNRTVDTAASPVLPDFPAQPPALEALVERALEGRSDLRAGRADIAAADASLRLAGRELWPDLEFTLQYGQRPGDMRTERMGSLMVGASLPLFGRSRQRRMREDASAMHDMADAELRSMTTETRHMVTAAHAELTQDTRLLQLYRTTLLPTTQAALESALSSYRAGAVDFMTLLDAQMAVVKLREDVAQAEGALGRSYAELGTLLGSDLLATRAGSEPNEGGTAR